MRAGASDRRDSIDSEKIARGLLQKIAAMDPYADADPAEVEQRLRNMHYGSTHNRISQLRRSETDADDAT